MTSWGKVNGLKDKAAIAGIGQTEFSKGLGRSEYDMAVEAIWAACEDAGISPRDINGIVRYDIETTDEEQLISVLGNPEIRLLAIDFALLSNGHHALQWSPHEDVERHWPSRQDRCVRTCCVRNDGACIRQDRSGTRTKGCLLCELYQVHRLARS